MSLQTSGQIEGELFEEQLWGGEERLSPWRGRRWPVRVLIEEEQVNSVKDTSVSYGATTLGE